MKVNDMEDQLREYYNRSKEARDPEYESLTDEFKELLKGSLNFAFYKLGKTIENASEETLQELTVLLNDFNNKPGHKSQ